MKTKKQQLFNTIVKYKLGTIDAEAVKYDIEETIKEAISDHEQAKGKVIEANEYEKSLGWKFKYEYLKALSEKAANISGEQVQMEVAEAVLIAFRELPEPYKKGSEPDAYDHNADMRNERNERLSR